MDVVECVKLLHSHIVTCTQMEVNAHPSSGSDLEDAGLIGFQLHWKDLAVILVWPKEEAVCVCVCVCVCVKTLK